MCNHSFPLMLFAAGFGTRMGHLTKDRPKPLVKVMGKPLIDHTIELAQAISPTKIVANVHYRADQITAHVRPRNITTVAEVPDILETGGGLLNALPHLGQDPVITSNTDAIWKGPNPFELLTRSWQPEKMDALLLCVPLENTIGHTGNGDFLIGEDGSLNRGPGVVYGGIQIIKTDGLSSIKEYAFSLNILWDKMISDGRIYGITYPGKWCDVGNAESISLAEKLLGACDV